MRQLLERNDAYVCRSFPDRNVSDNDNQGHEKSIMISMISALDMVESRWYLRFVAGLSVYFAIMASKNLQKSSAIQNNSITFALGDHSDYCL